MKQIMCAHNIFSISLTTVHPLALLAYTPRVCHRMMSATMFAMSTLVMPNVLCSF
ncbi:hypothetical protein BDQ94DRAFT_147832 [Aspergillus welwitschiae]|uniref:Uncharacterized protein n=1 Tax=Aspergillus welwitschiae TaxID=1341132 RepID=A0A3F3PXC8_9EURO|nr:hypothetical protein BDQ94DRAFT_147832 [Aspergillus welwitschiae]RDH30976.1 hypothetical protein BDQ94DRAFT_147832 [Aspergillus welwitschiae]